MVSYEKRESSNHATSLGNKHSHHHIEDLNVSSSMWHIENFDYRSNSPCKSSVQLNVSRKGVWPINSRCSLISLNLAKDKFGKGGVEGRLSSLYRSSYCSKTRSALYLWGFIYSLTALGRQPNNLPKYFWCNFRLLFILQSIANREDRLSLFQLSQLFYSFKGL